MNIPEGNGNYRRHLVESLVLSVWVQVNSHASFESQHDKEV
jgi:hypothetical protein